MDKCRICFQGSDLISPCACKGSMKFIHLKCLEKWKVMSQNIQCEVCLQVYSTIPSGLIFASVILAWANYITWYISIQILSAYIFSLKSFGTSLLPGLAFLTLRHCNLYFSLSVLAALFIWESPIISYSLALVGNLILFLKIIKRSKRLAPRLLVLLVEFNKHENDF